MQSNPQFHIFLIFYQLFKFNLIFISFFSFFLFLRVALLINYNQWSH